MPEASIFPVSGEAVLDGAGFLRISYSSLALQTLHVEISSEIP